MNKPYVICYMMTSIDGRIDCPMTASLPGVDDYYKVLDELDIPSSISGKVTAELELALPGKYQPVNNESINKDIYSKKIDSKDGYDVIVDTSGTLLWNNDIEYEKPHIIIASQKVSKEYLKYLDTKNISYIVSGKDSIDLVKAVDVLYNAFNIKRLGIVGGSKINTSFLTSGLLDEVVMLIGAGIDARANYPTLFDGLNGSSKVIQLKLNYVKALPSQAVLISYQIIK